MKRLKNFFIILLLIMIILSLMLRLEIINTDINIDLSAFRQKQYELYQQLRKRKAPQITISDENLRGNSPSNVNNHGEAVETEDYIFYINDSFQIFRTDKEFSNLKLLLHRTQGSGYSSLNVLDEWIYYRHKNDFYRMDFEGNNQTKVFSFPWMYKPHFIGNWIYFYTLTDGTIYRIDINGNNLQVLYDGSVVDMTVYEDRIFYSFNRDDSHYVSSMDFEGGKQETIAEIGANKMVVQGNYLFYVDTINNNLCRWDMVNQKKLELTQENVLNFSVDGEFIYYNHWDSEQYGYPGRELYRISINGEDAIQLSDDFSTGHFNIIEGWIVFAGAEDENQNPSTKRMEKDTWETVKMGGIR